MLESKINHGTQFSFQVLDDSLLSPTHEFGHRFIVLAPSGTGKSVLVRDLLRKICARNPPGLDVPRSVWVDGVPPLRERHFVILSPSEGVAGAKNNTFYGDFIGSGANVTVLNTLITKETIDGKEAETDGDIMSLINFYSTGKMRYVEKIFIIDDFTLQDDKDHMCKKGVKFLEDLFKNRRKDNFTVFLFAHDICDVPPSLRSQASGIISRPTKYGTEPAKANVHLAGTLDGQVGLYQQLAERISAVDNCFYVSLNFDPFPASVKSARSGSRETTFEDWTFWYKATDPAKWKKPTPEEMITYFGIPTTSFDLAAERVARAERASREWAEKLAARAEVARAAKKAARAAAKAEAAAEANAAMRERAMREALRG